MHCLQVHYLVGHFRLPLPLAFLPLFFFPQRVFPWELLHKTLIDTILCVQLSQFELLHAYALLRTPVSATKLTFETAWYMSNFRFSFFEKIAGHRKR